jgi:hypothetical protein
VKGRTEPGLKGPHTLKGGTRENSDVRHRMVRPWFEIFTKAAPSTHTNAAWYRPGTGHLASTSLNPKGLTPYGMSFWALILAACGGGGGGGSDGPVTNNSLVTRDPPGNEPVTGSNPSTASDESATASLAGRVVDGPVEGAGVYLDVNGNGRRDALDPLVGTTNRGGYYVSTVKLSETGHAIIADLSGAVDHGFDLATDADNRTFPANTEWRAPSDASIVSPLTEMLVRIYGVRPTGDQKAAFAQGLGLPDNIDVTRHDSFSIRDPDVRTRMLELGVAANNLINSPSGRVKDKDPDPGLIFEQILSQYDALQNDPPRTQDAAPTSLDLDIHQDSLRQDHSGALHLATIRITDDGLGANQLATLPRDGLFEYRNISRTGAELWLKADAALHDVRPGQHDFRIALADNLAPHLAKTFSLTVEDDAFAPDVRLLSGQHALGERPANAAHPALFTGVTLAASDKDGDSLGYAVDHPDFVMKGAQLWLRAGRGLDYETSNGQNRNDPGTLDLVITVTDNSRQGLSSTIDVRLTITNRNEPTTGYARIGPLDHGSAHIDTLLTADVQHIEDPDGPLQFSYQWFRGIQLVGEQSTYSPDQASDDYRLEVTATDPIFHTSKTFTKGFSVNAPPPPPPVNQRPSAITLGRASVSVDEGQLPDPNHALTRITITDDGLGSVGLEPLHANSIFRFQQISRTTYDLLLKDNVVLDQSRVGDHLLPIQVRADGAGTAALPHTGFTLTVNDIEHDPVLRVIGNAALDEGQLRADTPTGVTLNVSDADGGTPPITVSGDAQNRFRIDGDRLLANNGAVFISGERINLTITARDATNRSDSETVSFIIGDIEHDPMLTVTSPSRTPTINETIGDGTTPARIDTGITVRASDRDNNLRPLVIESWRGGAWQTDDRFEVTGTSLFIRAGQQLDHEDADNPGGVIRVRITASDAAGNIVHRETTVQLTNVNEPTTGSVQITGLTNGAVVAGTSTLTAVLNFTDPDDPNLEVTTTWVRIGGGMDPVNARSFAPAQPGQYMLMTLVRDTVTNTPFGVPPQSFTVTTAPVQPQPVQPQPVQPPPEIVPGIELAHAIYENHPLTKPIVDLTGVSQFRMAAVRDAPDNAFFRVDAATGKIWFQPSMFYMLLNYENPRDAGGNNIYDLQIIRTAPDGTQETINLALTVQDLPLEYAAPQLHPHWHLREVIKFKFPQVETAIESWVDTHRSELSDEDRQAEADFMKTLLYGRAWAMPQEGPLVITWSFATPQSPLGSRVRRRDPYDPNNPENGQRYLVSQDKIETYRETFERAFAEYEKVANIKFVEVGEVQNTHAMMRIDIIWNSVKSGAASLNVHKGGGIRLDHPYDYSTVLHEIIHALGVSHPFEEHSGFPGNPVEKSLSNSIASYGPRKNEEITRNDINILQFLYGAPGTNFEGLQSIIDDLNVNLPPDHPYLDIV